jgi:hypothetical protein
MSFSSAHLAGRPEYCSASSSGGGRARRDYPGACRRQGDADGLQRETLARTLALATAVELASG